MHQSNGGRVLPTTFLYQATKDDDKAWGGEETMNEKIVNKNDGQLTMKTDGGKIGWSSSFITVDVKHI